MSQHERTTANSAIEISSFFRDVCSGIQDDWNGAFENKIPGSYNDAVDSVVDRIQDLSEAARLMEETMSSVGAFLRLHQLKGANLEALHCIGSCHGVTDSILLGTDSTDCKERREHLADYYGTLFNTIWNLGGSRSMTFTQRITKGALLGVPVPCRDEDELKRLGGVIADQEQAIFYKDMIIKKQRTRLAELRKELILHQMETGRVAPSSNGSKTTPLVLPSNKREGMSQTDDSWLANKTTPNVHTDVIKNLNTQCTVLESTIRRIATKMGKNIPSLKHEEVDADDEGENTGRGQRKPRKTKKIQRMHDPQKATCGILPRRSSPSRVTIATGTPQYFRQTVQ